eukprot:Gb_08652 [translate_table: standard]
MSIYNKAELLHSIIYIDTEASKYSIQCLLAEEEEQSAMADQRRNSRKNRRQETGLRTAWCCASSIPNSPDRRFTHKEKSSTQDHSNSKDSVQCRKGKKTSKPGETKCLPSGEVATLIKQGFMEKQQRILSPGRVSPLIEPSTNPTVPVPSAGSSPPKTAVSSPMPSAKPLSGDPTPGGTLQEIMSHEAESLKLQADLSPNRASRGIESGFDDRNSSDVAVTLKGTDGRVVKLDLHSEVLFAQSQYFASKLSECPSIDGVFAFEVSDCSNLESYQAAIELMYCRNSRCRLMEGNISTVIGIMEVSARILFDTGVKACLEYLEAMPWTEEDEERVRTLLSQVYFDKYSTQEVLGRLHLQEQAGSEKLLIHVVQSVTKGTDEKARREMKSLVSRMLRENSNQKNDPSSLLKDDLYGLCHDCLDSLMKLFIQATSVNPVNEIAEDKGSLITRIGRQVDNLNWLLEILVDRHIADDFVRIWANQLELLERYKQTSPMVRYEVNRLTAKLFMALGKGQILCSSEARYTLLQTWLQPLVDDFGWIQRCCKGLDMRVVEEAISQTILTLPMNQQRSILLCWLECFSNSGNGCLNLQKAFEVWWRRSFLKPPDIHGPTADVTC